MSWNRRMAAVAAHDLIMAALSFELAVGLRYLAEGTPVEPFSLWEGTLIFTGVSAVVFAWIGTFRGIWRYASMDDLLALTKAVTLAILISLPLLFFATRLEALPRATPLIQWPILMLLLAGPRLLVRAWRAGTLRLDLGSQKDERVPVLLVGAGAAAETFVRDMRGRRNAPYTVVGLVDNKASRIGRHLHGVRVLSDLAQLPGTLARLTRRGRRPRRLLLTDDSLDSDALAALLDLADREGLTLGRLPKLTDFRAEGEADTATRPVDLVDLLRRPQKVLDRDAMRRLVEGRRVLVTGAGGTIGGELVRQIADLAPARLVLYENGEHALYLIDLELGERHPTLPRRAVLGDVRDARRLGEVFAAERPELVFHAAAFKHVPLVEHNPIEAVLTNVVGTRRVAAACAAHGARVMLLISTDKAVNPTSVMGASKRIAEMVVQHAAGRLAGGADEAPRFVAVRFGNVLGSTGSVVPLFQRQLARGGPLTVTHPDVTRYFMTQGEAVELILQAAALDDPEIGPGRIFVLDMGKPVRIQDLARQMIRLAGKRPDIDVAVTFTGLRPGEKLHEELRHAAEMPTASRQEGILLADPRRLDPARLEMLLDQIEIAAQAQDVNRVLALVETLVPEYQGGEAPDRGSEATRA